MDSPQGSIFCRSWWLDAVCPGQYEILVLRKGPRILAGMPMHRIRKFGFKAIHMPPLTHSLGVLFPPPVSDNYEKNFSTEMDILRILVKAIPKVSYFNMYAHYNITNWLPFYWAGYRQTTCYSYVLYDLNDLEMVFGRFAHSKRKNIKKAARMLEVKENLPAKEFYANHKLTLSKQGRSISYSSSLFYRLYEATHQRNAGKTWYTVDRDGNLHAAIFVVFDSKSAYYLISTIDPEFRNSGASTLLIKRAIEYLAPFTQRFDFEGSMIEGVENSFRRFGARQIPYFAITRSNLAIEFMLSFRNGLEKLRRKRQFA